jgi:hypothetical protein
MVISFKKIALRVSSAGGVRETQAKDELVEIAVQGGFDIGEPADYSPPASLPYLAAPVGGRPRGDEVIKPGREVKEEEDEGADEGADRLAVVIEDDQVEGAGHIDGVA